MDVFTMVVVIVVISCVAGVANNYIKDQREARESDIGEDAEEQLAELRGRIEVLEQIVTDDRYHISKEIRQLEG